MNEKRYVEKRRLAPSRCYSCSRRTLDVERETEEREEKRDSVSCYAIRLCTRIVHRHTRGTCRSFISAVFAKRVLPPRFCLHRFLTSSFEISSEVHPNIHVCGEKEARERLFSFETEDGRSVIAIGFPSSPLTDEEISLLVRFSSKSPLKTVG